MSWPCGAWLPWKTCESSVDELLEISGLDKARAGELIMTARIPWFAAEEING